MLNNLLCKYFGDQATALNSGIWWNDTLPVQYIAYINNFVVFAGQFTQM